MNRREFLRATGLAAAVLAVGEAFEMAQPDGGAMFRREDVGKAGTGEKVLVVGINKDGSPRVVWNSL